MFSQNFRTLAEDIGAALGCLAHVTELHRVAAGPYREDRMRTLEAVRDGGGHQALDTSVLLRAMQA
ncbi:hypothetical protein [Endozoicomonas euniceicola]|uniref:tRNA pseudouridylate synthase B C-terminal domain-containing protein n=1 Tax=Endozoicomonas euniceicola TaxID=1234143 RepID=A0ABY6GN99_9GAMM|nr:hypothetical protein [Endozoicomonas euniceicola]UYM14202.1 hypothetical protein NX720_14965 [Endozoicomonas euniceicola]